MLAACIEVGWGVWEGHACEDEGEEGPGRQQVLAAGTHSLTHSPPMSAVASSLRHVSVSM